MVKSLSSVHYYLLSCLAGIVLSLAYAPYSIILFAFVVPGVLWYLMHALPHQQRPILFFIFSLTFFATSLFWLHDALALFIHQRLLSIGLILGLMLLLAGLWTVSFAYFYRPKACGPGMRSIIYFTLCWLLSESIRGQLGHFPWLFLAYALAPSPWLVLAPYLGTYGLSALMIVCSTAAMYCLYRRWLQSLAVLSLLVSVSLTMPKFLQPLSPLPVLHGVQRIVLVQPNIDAAAKMQLNSQGILRHEYLQSLHDPDTLIIWPESALPGLSMPHAALVQALNRQLIQRRQSLITGAMWYHSDGSLRNVALLLGRQQGRYDKRHLVPFGEFIPLHHMLAGISRNLFPIPWSNLTPGATKQPLFEPYPSMLIQPWICYDVAFSDQSKRMNTVTWIVLISDDAWYQTINAVAQHRQIAQFRAAQLHKPILFVNNSGLTSIIDSSGHIRQQLGNRTAGMLLYAHTK